MISNDRSDQYHQLTTTLDNYYPVDWNDIVKLLEKIKNSKKALIIPRGEGALKFFARGTTFITFGYGIDGATIEMTKYAHTLSNLLKPFGDPTIHFIGGNFQPEIASIFDDAWHQFQLDGIDGWDKWDDGKWFKALFRKKMISFFKESNQLTKEIYQQAVMIAKQLGRYFIDHQISLVIPVNIASNPGNIALTLGLVLVTEFLGIHVLNSNHDFYWESGKPLSERELGEKPGIRDHFFKNITNKTFFSLFRSLYPWNGNRWLQININDRQSRTLINKYGFPKEKVLEISTSIADTFFEPYSKQDVTDSRLRMGHILSNGQAIIHPTPIDNHLSGVNQWMKNQQPVILGANSGLAVNPKSDDLIILLQPTRVVGRKRIERNLDLIRALFRKSVLREKFQSNPNRQLILLITGPVPKEHQEDLEKVLLAYQKTTRTLPEKLAIRIFLAFSVGRESHASFSENQFLPLTIEAIYRMANAVVFPSQTEGRGLPIIEASAIGIPIICSQYRPKEVFNDVVGGNLSKEQRIKYTLFPEGGFHRSFLSEVANLLLHPETQQKRIIHNREVVHTRYSYAAFNNKFEQLLEKLYLLE